MSATQIATMLVRAGQQLAQGLSSALETGLNQYCRESVRPDVTQSRVERERVYEGEAVSHLPITDVVQLFDQFAEQHLTEWRKTASFVTNGGAAVTEYSGQTSPALRLHAQSWAGSVLSNNNWRSGRGGIEARVTYRYSTRFELQRIPGGTLLKYRTVELPDPHFSAGYDLTRHFEAPRLPGGFGRVGELFLQHCAY